MKRCAIYTRKSTEDGLDQAFNSLDAQREACAAYILSQGNEGWVTADQDYDDGGYSGGTMVRPALQRLLADVAAGEVQIVVVYKVDRLTRSIADFARIVEALDQAAASFVSVTQAFNTTTSMGRLTLNVLLSFAQFERELTSERIRDKIAASKRKGMWMGGNVPMGYRVEQRKLVVEESEASTVRLIFRLYSELMSTGSVAKELASAGLRSRVRTFSDGKTTGGCCFSIGSLNQILKNPLFAGKVRHRGTLYDGLHEPIIDLTTWQRVQSILASNCRARRLGQRSRSPSLLAGMVVDPDGQPMTPVFTTKGPYRYRYYVTRARPAHARAEIWRVPARELEAAVLEYAERQLSGTGLDGASVGLPMRELSTTEQRSILLSHRTSIRITESTLELRFGGPNGTPISIPIRLRKGRELKLVVEAEESARRRSPDASLFRLVALALAAQRALLASESDDLLSAYSKRHIYKLLRLSWLAPDILAAICKGSQPVELTSRRLLRAAAVPLEWDEQRGFFGFGKSSQQD